MLSLAQAMTLHREHARFHRSLIEARQVRNDPKVTLYRRMTPKLHYTVELRSTLKGPTGYCYDHECLFSRNTVISGRTPLTQIIIIYSPSPAEL
jgi:hypothetical protein